MRFAQGENKVKEIWDTKEEKWIEFPRGMRIVEPWSAPNDGGGIWPG